MQVSSKVSNGALKGMKNYVVEFKSVRTDRGIESSLQHPNTSFLIFWLPS
jgi:hypothetical protein